MSINKQDLLSIKHKDFFTLETICTLARLINNECLCINTFKNKQKIKEP